MSKVITCLSVLAFATPASSVREAGSVGSSSIAPMESPGRSSVNDVHDGRSARAFSVRQIPPLTAPM